METIRVNSEIVNAIKSHADKEGSGYRNWYCGIASDPDKRLFNDHNVPRKENEAWWIKKKADSEKNARDTEAYLMQLGFDGGTGGGDYTTIHIYAYKKILGITQE